MGMSHGHQDWTPQVVRKKGGAGGGATGPTVTTKKYAAGGNAQSSGPGQRARKLDEANGEDGFKTEKVSMELKMRIQKARQAKGMTQKELATKMSEKPQVVNQYESGQAIQTTKCSERWREFLASS